MYVFLRVTGRIWVLKVTFMWGQRPIPVSGFEGAMRERIKLLMLAFHGDLANEKLLSQ